MRARIVNLSAAALCVASAAACVWIDLNADLKEIAATTGANAPIYPVFLGLAWALTGSALAWLRPRNAVGWLLLGVGTCQTVSVVTALYGGYGLVLNDPPLPLARWSAWLGSGLWPLGILPLVNVLLAIYPEGRLPNRTWRWLVAGVSVGIAMLSAVLFMSQEAYDDVAPGPSPATFTAPQWLQLSWALTAAILVLGGTLVIWFRSALRLARSRPPERQQLAWLLLIVVPFMLSTFTQREALLVQAAGFLIPVAIAVGVFRYNLLGIEIVLRRALVFGTLTAIVIAVYLTVTSIAGSGLDRVPLPGIAAAAIVAVALMPIRERLQRRVDRFVYGERSDPLRAVTRLGDRVAAADEPDLLAAVLGVVTAAVRAPGAAVTTADGRVVATHGAAHGAVRGVATAGGTTYPLRVGGVDVGLLRVTERSPGEAFTAGDQRLLAALVPQVAVVVRALELAEALEAERDRVVAATRTERDRLRHDLHDGLGPSLAGIRLGLAALQEAHSALDHGRASELLSRIRVEVDATVGEVRRIIEGFRPAVLDDTGLPGALRRYTESVSGRVFIDLAMADLPPLPPEVETAAYRIAQEALTNVVLHAAARRAWVTLAVTHGDLTVEVRDDGAGIEGGLDSEGGLNSDGVGLASMRLRAESLGGTFAMHSTDSGTTVFANLPLAGRAQ